MKLTYFGHSAFRIESGSSVILIDPFLTGNPHFDGDLEAAAKGLTHIVLSHGHGDHVGDTVDLAKRHGASVVATFELAQWLKGKGVEKIEPGNTGGTIKFGDFSVTLTQAFHSSAAIDDNGETTYLGMPNGLVFHFSEGPSVYHMGDTDIFGDMALIEELHHPEIGLVPIGDRFTMGAAVAALACRRYFNFKTVIPIHWGTIPALDSDPQPFVDAMEGDGNRVLLPKMNVPFEV
ncbi:MULTISPECIES: metal-dependent hydrolase [unclassified Aureimonas]|uniref:metal-dependent hydrolase n=1 Tax=unclassified Aureimonas TaxID=2615206 RepID=UPI0006F664C7|nr:MULTISPECIES: metal-dependent hydrolase [unclassified Aureimonas]KQT60426.1 hydrolase [Aureimonas sp. Leaf427]KQT79304.1 hydrolase [Aureimonas sp. Leaf460]